MIIEIHMSANPLHSAFLKIRDISNESDMNRIMWNLSNFVRKHGNCNRVKLTKNNRGDAYAWNLDFKCHCKSLNMAENFCSTMEKISNDFMIQTCKISETNGVTIYAYTT